MNDIEQELREGAELRLEVADTYSALIQAMSESIWDSMSRGGKLLRVVMGEVLPTHNIWRRNVLSGCRPTETPFLRWH